MDLITQTLKLKDVYPDKAKALAEQMGKSEDELLFVRKGLVAEDLSFSEGERAAVSYITTAGVDRDSEIVDPAGADLSDYQKNPVVLWCHDYKQLPLGKNMWIKSDANGLVAKTQYAKHDMAEKVYEYRKDGFPLAQSIGFMPVEWTDFNPGQHPKGARREYTKWKLLEYSDVPVPANPEAVNIAVSKGLLPKEPAANKAALNGQPSTYDIMNVINMYLNPQPTTNWSNYKWVSDLYPVSYPSGNCVIGDNANQGKYFAHTYKYENDQVSYWSEGVEVDMTYMPSIVLEDSKLMFRDSANYIQVGETEKQPDSVTTWASTLPGGTTLKCFASNAGGPKVGDVVEDDTKYWIATTSNGKDFVYGWADNGNIKWSLDPPQDLVEKVGAVLSRKNKTLITNAIAQMQEAVDALEELLDAAEPQEVEDDGKEAPVVEHKHEPEPVNVKQIVSNMISKQPVLDANQIADRIFNKLRGRVTA